MEDYLLFIPEKLSVAVKYAFKMSLIYALIIILSLAIYVFNNYNSIENYISEIIPDFTYTDGEIEFSDASYDDSEMEVLISTLASSLGVTETEFSKETIVNQFSNLPTYVYVVSLIAYAFMNGIDIFIYWCFIAVFVWILACIILSMSKIKMKSSISYALSIYATTLSMALMAVYSILNSCFGIYIDIFDYIFVIIPFIYITAVILIIKSELLKQQIELIRITNIQQEIKEDIERRKENENEEEEKKRIRDKDSEENKKKEKNDSNEDGNRNNENKDTDAGNTKTNEETDTSDEPDGSEI